MRLPIAIIMNLKFKTYKKNEIVRTSETTLQRFKIRNIAHHQDQGLNKLGVTSTVIHLAFK